jgi:hypothetical protein
VSRSTSGGCTSASTCCGTGPRLDAAEDGLCFGRLDLETGERRHIGRIGLRDESGEGEPLLIDWRAPAARAFYVATAVAPHGIRRRRHISPVFLGYISQVLPGLGETNVLLRTVGELFPGVAAFDLRAEGRLAEEVKGRAMMAGVVAAAVRDRQAEGPASFEFGGETLRLDGHVVASAARRARATRLPHNQARPLFQRQIIAALAERYAENARELAERIEADVADVLAGAREAIEADLAAWPEVPGSSGDSQPDLAEVRRELRADAGVRARLDDLWPALTPQRLLEELFADPARLAVAAPALPASERAALRREPRRLDRRRRTAARRGGRASRAGRTGGPGAFGTRTGAAGRLRPGRARHRFWLSRFQRGGAQRGRFAGRRGTGRAPRGPGLPDPGRAGRGRPHRT